jgi:uncharacterized protein
VQEHWLSIVRFDAEENLQAWLSSSDRERLVEATEFTERFRSRIARTGFDQWFRIKTDGAPKIAVWKQNMLVLLLLYPVVFFCCLPAARICRSPLRCSSAPIVLLSYLVPWTSMQLSWWLVRKRAHEMRLHVAGLALVIARSFVVCVLVVSVERH